MFVRGPGDGDFVSHGALPSVSRRSPCSGCRGSSSSPRDAALGVVPPRRARGRGSGRRRQPSPSVAKVTVTRVGSLRRLVDPEVEDDPVGPVDLDEPAEVAGQVLAAPLEDGERSADDADRSRSCSMTPSGVRNSHWPTRAGSRKASNTRSRRMAETLFDADLGRALIVTPRPARGRGRRMAVGDEARARSRARARSWRPARTRAKPPVESSALATGRPASPAKPRLTTVDPGVVAARPRRSIRPRSDRRRTSQSIRMRRSGSTALTIDVGARRRTSPSSSATRGAGLKPTAAVGEPEAGGDRRIDEGLEHLGRPGGGSACRRWRPGRLTPRPQASPA